MIRRALGLAGRLASAAGERLTRAAGGPAAHRQPPGAAPQPPLPGTDAAVTQLLQRSNPFHYAATAWLGDHTALALLHGRLLMYLDTRGTDLAPHVMMFGIWEPAYTQLFQRLIRPGDTVLDIGAHLGVYTLLGAVATGAGGQVHAFEPNARFAGLLGRSLSANGLAGFAKVHNVAAGVAAGETELRFNWEYSGGAHLAVARRRGPREAEAQPCRVVALDELFPDPGFTVDVVKMDVEGTETGAVRGMTGLLGRSPRARIMFEFAPQMLRGHGSSAAELIGLLDGLGFRFWTIGADSALAPEPAAALAARSDGLSNILAARGDPEHA